MTTSCKPSRVSARAALMRSLSLACVLTAAAHPAWLCAADAPKPEASAVIEDLEPIILREGDELQITFPGAPTLNTTQRIRTDGRITLSLLGEIIAVGTTPADFQTRLAKLYEKQLVSREVTVTLLTRQFFVYVNGSVDTHGRLDFDRPVALLEAVMAAGFGDGTVNLKAVKVTRNERGAMRTYTVNLEDALRGKTTDVFHLKQGDMIIVPGRIL